MKIIAIVGSYRKGHIIDQAVSAALESADRAGAQTEKIYLLDKSIEFCDNCRVCTQQSGSDRQACVHEHEDDMAGILAQIDGADGIILASPTNFFGVTALMQRFVERLIVYTYWPWGKGIPKPRKKKLSKQAVIITATAAPAFIARLAMRNPYKVLKQAATLTGARVVRSVRLGMVAQKPDQPLNEKQLAKAAGAGQALADSFD